MQRSTIEFVKLTASDGMTLTNGTSFSKEVYLGVNDSADNWREITDEEAQRQQEQFLYAE
jgi:hypothetical protein